MMEIQFYDACKVENSLFLSACNFNGLFRFDLETEELSFVSHFPCEKLSKKYLHSGVIKSNNKVFFIPYSGCSICSFDLKKNEFEYDELCDKDTNYAFVFPLIYKKKVFIIPSDLSGNVFRLEEGGEKFTVDRRLTDIIHDLLKLEQGAMCDLSGCAIHDNILIIGLFGKSKILKIDIESGEANVLTTNGITVGNLIFYNDSVWIVSSDGEKCSKITEDGNTLCEYNLCESNTRGYQLFVAYNGELYLLGCVKDSLLKLVDNNWVEVVNEIPIEFKRVTEWAFLSGSKVIDDDLFLFPISGNGIVKINQTGSYSFMKTSTSDFTLDRIKKLKHEDMKEDISGGIILRESNENELDSFLAFIANCN